jgi:molecular chaperone GrpE
MSDEPTQLPDSENPHAAEFAVLQALQDEVASLKDQRLRALAEAENIRRRAEKVKAVLDGVEATDRQLMQTLERYGVKQVDTSDGKFDPNLHQAIAEVPGNGKPAGTIVDVVQSGFMIGDRLLRPAMVTVARKDVPAQSDSVDTRA